MYKHLSSFARRYYEASMQQNFGDLKDPLEAILRFEGKEKDRIEQWLSAIRDGTIYESEPDEYNIDYNPKDWESEKNLFSERRSSRQSIRTHAYRYHQAASLHRHYVLKELLPAHGIAIS